MSFIGCWLTFTLFSLKDLSNGLIPGQFFMSKEKKSTSFKP